MRFTLFTIAAAAVLFSADASAQTNCDTLGPAKLESIFVFGNYSATASDIAGAAAVGGNLNVSNYSIGQSLSQSGGVPTALTVGGNLTFNGGTIYGNVFHIGSSSITGATVNGTVQTGSTIDFAGAQTQMNSLTTTFAGLAANGTTTVQYGTVTLKGTSTTLNVFNVTSANVASASGIQITVPSSSLVVVNISGASVQLQNMGISLNGLSVSNVLWNMPTATSLTMQGIAIEGTILAPHAAVTFANGHIDGSLTALSFTGGGQTNYNLFTACVPVPSTCSGPAAPSLAISAPAIASPLIPGQQASLTMNVSNVGCQAATTATMIVTAPGGAQTTLPGFALAAGATTTLTTQASVPTVTAKQTGETDSVYLARLTALDNKAISFGYRLTWTDSGGHAYGPATAASASTEVLPILQVALSAPASAGPGDTINYSATVTNSGHASASAPVLSLTLPDSTTRTLTLPATIAAGAASTVTSSFSVATLTARGASESVSAYLARLGVTNGMSLTARASVSWQDTGHNNYGSVSATASTTERVPILSATASAPATTLPGQVATVSFTLHNTGGAAASAAVVTIMGPDGISHSSAPLTVAAGASAAVTLNSAAAGLIAKGAGETDAAYATRLTALDQSSVTFTWSVVWQDSAGDSYGSVNGVSQVTMVAPVLSLSLTAPANTTPGAQGTSSIVLANTGHASAISSSLSITLPDGSTQSRTVAALAPGQSTTVSATWSAPPIARRQSGETVTAYLARLRAADSAGLSSSATLGWSDGSNSYGQLSAVARTTQHVPVLLPSLLSVSSPTPGQPFLLSFSIANQGTGAAVSAALSSGAVTQSVAVPAGATTAVQLAVPSPAVAARLSGETDAAYLGRLQAAATAKVSNGWTIDWTGASADSYGTVDGNAQGTQVLPIITLALSAPANAHSGDTIHYTLTATNAGSAAAQAIAVQLSLPSAATVVAGLPSVLAAGASATLGIDFAISAAQPTGTLSAQATATWQDAATVSYGPLGASASTNVIQMRPPGLALAIAAPDTANPGQMLTYRVTATNIGGASLSGPAASITFPEYTIGIAFDALAAGASAFVDVPWQVTTVDRRGGNGEGGPPGHYFASDDDYRAYLHQYDGSPLVVSATAQASTADGTIVQAAAGAVTTELLPILVVTVLSLPTPFVDGDTVPLALTVVNEGSGVAHRLGVSVNSEFNDNFFSNSETPQTTDIPALSTVQTTVNARVGFIGQDCFYNFDPGCVDGGTTSIFVNAFWTDDAQGLGYAYGWVTSQTTGSVLEPVLTNVLTADLPRHLPLQPVNLTLNTQNIGHAYASGVVLSTSAFSYALPDFAQGASAVFTPAVPYFFPLSGRNGYFYFNTDADYLLYLHDSTDLGWGQETLSGTLTWQDRNGNQFGNDGNALSDVIAPIVTPRGLTASPAFLGQTSTIALSMNNEGSAPGHSVSLLSYSFLGDQRDLSTTLDLAAGQGGAAQFQLIAGYATSEQAGETDSAYLARLTSYIHQPPILTTSESWTDDLGATYGPLFGGETTVRLLVPVLATPANLLLVAGAPTQVLLSETGSVTSAVTPQAVVHLAPYADFACALPDAAPQSAGTCTWSPPLTLTNSGSDDSAYLTGLRALTAPVVGNAQLTWLDLAGESFGPLTVPVTGQINPAVVSILAPATASLLPGVAVAIQLQSERANVSAATIHNGTRDLGVAVGSSFGNGAVVSTQLPVAAPAPVRSIFGDDASYLAALTALEGPAAATFTVSWLDSASRAYGPIHGSVQGTVAAPILALRLSGPDSNSNYALTLENTGHAAASTALVATLQDGTQTNLTPQRVAAGATQQLSFADHTTAVLPAPVRIDATWTDDAGNAYGAISAVAGSAFTVDAGPNTTVPVAAGASLSGKVTYGASVGGIVTSTWSQISGPGWVTFADASQPRTHASFSEPGSYSLRLRASDGQAASSATVTITVAKTPPAQNQAPVVSAGPDQTLFAEPLASPPPFQLEKLGLQISWFDISGVGDYPPSGELMIGVRSNHEGLAVDSHFDLLHANGSGTRFSDGSFGYDELYFAVIPSDGPTPGVSIGGFQAGDLYFITYPSGAPPTINRFTRDGQYQANWIIIPGMQGGARAPITTDPTGVFGGDLIACTTAGQLYRINSTGQVSLFANTHAWAEGIQVIPNDPTRYGPWAGKVLVSDEVDNLLFTADTAGNIQSWDLGIISPEGVHVVPPAANLYIADNGGGNLYGAPAAQLQPYVGDVIVTEEDSGVLLRVRWTGTQFQVNELGTTGNGAEGIAFSSAGLLQIPDARPSVTLNGSVSDDGLPNPPAQVTSSWSQVSGPGGSFFDNAAAPATRASFSAAGEYLLRLTASDSLLTSTSDVHVFVNPAEVPPSVNAGSDQTIVLPASASLVGSVDASGKALNQSVTTQWTLLQGPAPVTFSAPASLATSASFTQPGHYLLRLSASDGERSGTADVTINVLPAESIRVSAGAPQTLIWPQTSAQLLGSASVAPAAPLDLIWVQISGPAQAQLSATNLPQPSVKFPASGSYSFQLTATVHATHAFATAQTTVTVPSGPSANQPPLVSAGPDQAISLPTLTASLQGSVTDDGLPAGAALSISWSAVSGPGSVSFADPTAPVTTATVSAPGRYVLRLSASDSLDVSTSDVSVSFGLSGTNGPGGIILTNTDAFHDFSTGINRELLFSGIPWVTNGASALKTLLVSDPTPINQNDYTAHDSFMKGLPFANYDKASVNQAAGWKGLRTVDFLQYNLILVDSDSLGALRQEDVDSLTSRSADLIRFVNAGGGIIADSEAGVASWAVHTGADGYLPFGLQVSPTIYPAMYDLGSVTAAGLAWGLTAQPHRTEVTTSYFASSNGLSALFTTPAGTPVILAGRGTALSSSGVVNSAPRVTVPAEHEVAINQPAPLRGSITDDGLPAPALVTAQWTQVSGPGAVAFGPAASASTTATFTTVGRYVLRLTANDGQLSSSADAIVDAVPANSAPVVDAGATQFVSASPLRLSGSVSDDGYPAGKLSINWSEESGPGLATFADASDPRTLVSFTAPGTYGLRLTANDTALSTSASVIVVFEPPADENVAPAVSAGVAQTVTLPAAAQLQGAVADDGLPLNGSLVSLWSVARAPASATVTFADATAAQTTASFSIFGSYTLRLSANDGALTSSDTVIVTVLPDAAHNSPPLVSAGANQVLAYPLRTASLQGEVTDDGSPAGGALTAAWSLVEGPGSVAFSVATQTSTQATFSWPGIYQLRLSASDSQLSSSADVYINVGSMPGTAPVVALTSPDSGSRITAPATIEGTVSGGDWRLQYALGGDESVSQTFVTLASGTGAFTGTLATFDTTMLLNGTYELLFSSVSDQGEVDSSLSVVVDKNLKVGNFAVAFADLTIPVSGFPITVTRSYDSRDKRAGDFGVGWQLSVQDVRVEKSVILGKFWEETEQGYFALPSYCVQPTKPNIVTVTFPTGKVYRFQAGIQPSCQQFFPIGTPDFSFTPMQGTTAKLAVLGQSPTVAVQELTGIPGPVQLLGSDLEGVYNPIDFVLTLDDGTIYVLRQGAGVQQITDRNGNTLTFTKDGINSSAGKSIAFVRDADGRITTITDPNGKSLLYAYDQEGNLASFTDRTGNQTTFDYNTVHDLVTITDPRGITPLTNGYDTSTGRLTSTSDAAGKTIGYAHDLDNHRESVTDRLGHTTTFEYDTDGNVVHQIDALGHETFSTYDDNDNKLTDTDALGHTTTSTYDAQNNKLTETDPLGYTTTWTYNDFRQVLTMADPLGHTTTNVREDVAVCGHAAPSGNLLSTTNARNETAAYLYDCDGNLIQQTDAGNGVSGYSYDSSGHMLSMTDANNVTTSYAYDSNGNQLSEMRTRTVNGAPEQLVASYDYDDSSRRVKVTYPDGSTTRTAYNSIGMPAQTLDQLNRASSYTYDNQGRLTRTDYPDQTFTTTSYDDGGRRATSTGPGGRTTGYSYDELNRLVATTNPDLTTRNTEYDKVGRVQVSRDELNHPTTYSYDEAGRRVAVTDALNHSTIFGHDAAGNQTSVTDANSNAMGYVYDVLNRQTQVIYPDGTYEVTEYDPQGNRSARVDQAGIRTEYGYDLVSHLTTVINKNIDGRGMDITTSHAYDELGNRISQTDANNHTTQFGYDDMGRQASRTLPAGETEYFRYDALGNLQTKKDFNGKTTTYQYDDASRLTDKIPDASFGAPTIHFTYYDSGRRQTMGDITGTTTYVYDPRDRLLTKATPEGTLSYSYDAAGNRLTVHSELTGGYSVQYGYDSLNRLSTTTDLNDNSTTTYRYDPAGRLSSYDYPNGVTTTMAYDSLNRVQNISLATGGPAPETLASYSYTFYSTGNRQTVSELGGRVVTWSYDSLWRLTNETIAGAATAGSIGYRYDAVGNRLSRTSTVPGIPAQIEGYNPDDENSSVTFDSDGNTKVAGGNTYGYDFENRLTSLNNTQATYVYDGDGQLVSRTAGAERTVYLLDERTHTGYTQIAEGRVAESVVVSYVYGAQRLSMRGLDGVHYYGYDAHSGVRALMNPTRVVSDTYEYDAFGSAIGRNGTTDNPFTYRGEQVDSTLGLLYLRARWMDPERGRFWTRDTWEGVDMVLPSVYGYSDGAPVDTTDPSGHFAVPDVSTDGALSVIGTGLISGHPPLTPVAVGHCEPGYEDITSPPPANFPTCGRRVSTLERIHFELGLVGAGVPYSPWLSMAETSARIADQFDPRLPKSTFFRKVDEQHSVQIKGFQDGTVITLYPNEALTPLVPEITAATEGDLVHELTHVLQFFRDFNGSAGAQHSMNEYFVAKKIDHDKRWPEVEANRVAARAGFSDYQQKDDGLYGPVNGAPSTR